MLHDTDKEAEGNHICICIRSLVKKTLCEWLLALTGYFLSILNVSMLRRCVAKYWEIHERVGRKLQALSNMDEETLKKMQEQQKAIAPPS